MIAVEGPIMGYDLRSSGPRGVFDHPGDQGRYGRNGRRRAPPWPQADTGIMTTDAEVDINPSRTTRLAVLKAVAAVARRIEQDADRASSSEVADYGAALDHLAAASRLPDD